MVEILPGRLRRGSEAIDHGRFVCTHVRVGMPCRGTLPTPHNGTGATDISKVSRLIGIPYIPRAFSQSQTSGNAAKRLAIKIHP